MKIAVASDHAGFELKKGILDYHSEREIPHEDFGCGPEEKVNYVDFGEKAIQSLCSGRNDRAILVCGTGLGMAIVANSNLRTAHLPFHRRLNLRPLPGPDQGNPLCTHRGRTQNDGPVLDRR